MTAPMSLEEKVDEVLRLFREEREFMRQEREFMRDERALNNARFTQLATGLSDVRQEVKIVREDLKALDTKLSTQIDHAYRSLSQDINALTMDQEHTKRRVTKIEKHVF